MGTRLDCACGVDQVSVFTESGRGEVVVEANVYGSAAGWNHVVSPRGISHSGGFGFPMAIRRLPTVSIGTNVPGVPDGPKT